MTWLTVTTALTILGLFAPSDAAPKADKIMNLPGLVFETKYEQYSGYLLGNDDNGNYSDTHVFYWLVKSQRDPDKHKDPVIFWFNGGPGCSSLGGMFTENGPFHANPGGQTLFENVFGWNKFSNLVFVESPPAVGFSYTDDDRMLWSDDEVAKLNHAALADFFNKFDEFKDRDWYITGESYAGVYIPTMSWEIIKAIDNKMFPNMNFKGIAIGNGYVDQQLQTNSVIEFMYYHGLLSEKLASNAQFFDSFFINPLAITNETGITIFVRYSEYSL